MNLIIIQILTFVINEIIKQPELYMKAFDKNGLLSDFYITNKLIKREVLKVPLKHLKNIYLGKNGIIMKTIYGVI